MQEYIYRQLEDSTYCVMGYRGDETDPVIPEYYGGKPITVLYDDLFRGHSEIRSVHIPDTVTEMGEFIFDGCINLRTVELPSGVRHLWGHTFARSGIEEIILPDSLTILPPFAFKECRDLKKVVCGKGLRRICSWAFAGCDSLAELVHGPDVEISPDAFKSRK